MENVNRWITAKGVEITLSTRLAATDTINLDGHECVVAADGIVITACTVAGQAVYAPGVHLTQYQGVNVLQYGVAKINGKSHPLLIAIPAEVYEVVWGGYNRRQAAKLKLELDTAAAQQATHVKVVRSMEL